MAHVFVNRSIVNNSERSAEHLPLLVCSPGPIAITTISRSIECFQTNQNNLHPIFDIYHLRAPLGPCIAQASL